MSLRRSEASSSSCEVPSGIVSDSGGSKVVPSSIRADGSVRKERKVRPGYTPQEDVQRFRPRVISNQQTGVQAPGSIAGRSLTSMVREADNQRTTNQKRTSQRHSNDQARETPAEKAPSWRAKEPSRITSTDTKADERTSSAQRAMGKPYGDHQALSTQKPKPVLRSRRVPEQTTKCSKEKNNQKSQRATNNPATKAAKDDTIGKTPSAAASTATAKGATRGARDPVSAQKQVSAAAAEPQLGSQTSPSNIRKGNETAKGPDQKTTQNVDEDLTLLHKDMDKLAIRQDTL